MPDLLLENGHVITMNDQDDIFYPGYVVIDDDRITAVGGGQVPEDIRSKANEIVNASGLIVMPGLVNAHVHLFQTLIRGLSDNRPLIPWLEEIAFPIYKNMTPVDIFTAVKMGIVENIKGGATAVTDNFTVRQNQEGYHAVYQAAKEMGIRYKMARGYSDTGYPDELMETGDDVIAKTLELYDSWCKDDEMLSIDFSPNVVWSTTSETLNKVVLYSRDQDVGIHIHTAEDQKENEICLAENGLRQIPWLHQMGVLGPRTQLAHGIWINEKEMETIADSQSTVIHNPVSNMFIGAGICPVRQMKQAGIRVALGTDGQAVNCGQEMMDVLKWTANLQNVSTLDPGVIRPEQIIRMACRNGAYAFGQPDQIGSLEPTKKADLILISLDSSRLTIPTLSVPSLIVNFAKSEDVMSSIINGKFIMRDREILVLDEEQLQEEFQEVRTSLLGRVGIN